MPILWPKYLRPNKRKEISGLRTENAKVFIRPQA